MPQKPPLFNLAPVKQIGASADTQSELARILIVDDDPGIRELLRAVLRAAGHHTHEVAGGAEALEYMARTVPDLVLLDLWMPDLDGCRTLDEMRTRGLRERTRVLIVTGRPSDTCDPEMPRHILKPFHTEELLAAVNHALTEPPGALYARHRREHDLARTIQRLDRLLD
jgi:two-component system, OmpR family, response regulator